jgi:aurora kinase, other
MMEKKPQDSKIP